MNLYILCGNATFNRGDRVNLLAQIQLLKHKFPDADINVDSFRPEVDQAWYGVRVVKRSWFLSPHKFVFSVASCSNDEVDRLLYKRLAIDQYIPTWRRL
jgi:hypothetical protein